MKKSYLLLVIICLICGWGGELLAQNLASPANWRYPQGSAEGTRNVAIPSKDQILDSLRVKWSTPLISGDVQPLVGNAVNNDKIFSTFPYAPNELVAVVGDRIVIIDGKGKLVKSYTFPETVSGVISASVLIDTASTGSAMFGGNPVVIGLGTIEAKRSDSLAVAYVAGYNSNTKEMNILRRLSINLKNQSFYPNVSASLSPVFGRKDGDDYMIYATANMSQPVIGNPGFVEAPFLRGLTQFNTGNTLSVFPMPDVGDDLTSRLTLGPEVSFSQPSQTNYEGQILMVLPSYPTTGIDDIIPNDVISGGTAPSNPYLVGLDLSGSQVMESFTYSDLGSIINGTRPKIKPMYVNIRDAATGDSLFLLVAEEYNGRDGSVGTSALHLFDLNGNQLTSKGGYSEPPYFPPSYMGGKNCAWSVAIGDVDGYASNSWSSYYPNNAGNEIVVTQSSREFAVAGSKLSILRYNSGPEINKPSPPGEVLYALDTICTQTIKGWVACVNDFDGDLSNGKSEIFLVDGSDFMIVRMRDYADTRFRMGMPFDTVYRAVFPNQTISNLAVADMDGDGLNDIIVTTYDSTYVIGSPLSQTISVDYPKFANALKTDYCPSDSVEIRWNNIITGSGSVNILFLETVGGIPQLPINTVISNYQNTLELETLKFLPTENIIGKTGFFVVQSANNPYKNFDTTTIVTIHAPQLDLDSIEKKVYYSGSEFTVTGYAGCIDSLAFEVAYDTLSWNRIAVSVPDSISKRFSLSAQLPCMGIFSCSGKDIDTVIYGKVFIYSGDFRDTSKVFKLNVQPTPFPVTFDSCTSVCPTKQFKWNPALLNLPCDTLTISVSVDLGESFVHIASVPTLMGFYDWNIPTQIPDSVIVRFCCENSCIRTDTLIRDVKPHFISVVAPNPFKYPEECKITYTVPKDMNVTVKIIDQSNRLVKVLARDVQRNAETVYCETWDGNIPDGTPAASGMYYVVLEMSDGSREFYPVFVRK